MTVTSQVSEKAVTILVVEDDERVRAGLTRAFESVGYKVEAFAAGADDYVVKGPTARELLTRVGAHLQSAERERLLRGSNRELSFIADLGRGLLHALSPAEVVRRVAGATFEGADTSLSAAVLVREGGAKSRAGIGSQEGLAVCVFD